ncbi:MAG: nitroreductase family deazaflavin-dependent oxidoreductase [Anaerolineales bacterium]
MNFKLTRQQPHGLLRLFLRMPIALYRARLGWLLGGRFLMLTHTGRKSGQPRQTVLEVVHHDPATGAYFVAAAWGGKADWFRNIQANPAVQVTAGTRTFPATAVLMQADEAARIFLAYARRYPLAFRELSRMMFGETLQPTLEDCLRMAQSVPLVALTPKALAS